MTDRLFLDANILFSVSYMPESSLGRLWNQENANLITSEYAISEARRNLESDQKIRELENRLKDVDRIPTPSRDALKLPVEIPEKDRPILRAALFADASHLITGDKQDFGDWFGETISGLSIMRPATYLNQIS